MGKLIARYIIKGFLHILYPITLFMDMGAITICWLSNIKIKDHLKITNTLRRIIANI